MNNQLPNFDKTIHDPTRLKLLAYLNAANQADFMYLQRTLELTKGNLSSHITKLESVGFVQVIKTYKGKIPLTIVEITERGRAAFKKYKNDMKTLLSD